MFIDCPHCGSSLEVEDDGEVFIVAEDETKENEPAEEDEL